VILLNTTGSYVQIVTGGAQVMNIHVSWVDMSGSTITPGDLNTPISSATTTQVVGSPASTYTRNIKNLTINNTDSANGNTITVQHYDGTTLVTLKKITLPAQYNFNYEDKFGWYLTDSTGAMVNNPLTGRFLRSTTVLNGTTTFTTGAFTTTIRVKGAGAGGQGGGSPATAGTCGSGGGGGAYAEWTTSATANTAYTCAVGAGGSTSGTGATGQAGGTTTLAIGSNTLTIPGGSGGIVGGALGTPILGGAGGALPTLTTGTPNVAAAGMSGGPAIATATALANVSGFGGSTPLGAGAAALIESSNATGNSAAALGYGGGGGGSATSAATARAGGAAANAVLVIDEYS
jgi:hypothetical protein